MHSASIPVHIIQHQFVQIHLDRLTLDTVLLENTSERERISAISSSSSEVDLPYFTHHFRPSSFLTLQALPSISPGVLTDFLRLTLKFTAIMLVPGGASFIANEPAISSTKIVLTPPWRTSGCEHSSVPTETKATRSPPSTPWLESDGRDDAGLYRYRIARTVVGLKIVLAMKLLDVVPGGPSFLVPAPSC
jgi:hypothetical protein